MRTIVVVMLAAMATAVTPARASEESRGANCISAEEAVGHGAGDGQGADEDAAPKFSSAFYARTFTLDASLDGIDGKYLPVSIEDVCDVPKALAKQAVQLAGTDGAVLVTAHTRVWMDGQRVQGAAAITALDSADTAVLRVRLAPERRWGADEDGDRIPTFVARRIAITD
jgi:hypothetical protein